MLMRNEVYFGRDEKLGFFESLVFDHELDEDVDLIKRTGVNTEFALIVFLGVIAIIMAL